MKHPVAKPRTDNPRERSVVSSHLKPANRSSPHKNSERKDGHNNKKRESGEGSGVDNVKEKKARLQSKGNLSDGHTPKSVSTGETLQVFLIL